MLKEVNCHWILNGMRNYHWLHCSISVKWFLYRIGIDVMLASTKIVFIFLMAKKSKIFEIVSPLMAARWYPRNYGRGELLDNIIPFCLPMHSASLMINLHSLQYSEALWNCNRGEIKRGDLFWFLFICLICTLFHWIFID